MGREETRAMGIGKPAGHGERVLLIGIAVSLAAHAALTMGFVRYSRLTESSSLSASRPSESSVEYLLIPPDEPAPTPPIPEPPPQIRLGLDDGAPDASAWLGFTDETEHLAQQGPLDQSAMMLAEQESPPSQSPPEAASAPPELADLVSPEPAIPTLVEIPQPDLDILTLEAPDPHTPPTPQPQPTPDWSAELASAAQRAGEFLRDAITLTAEALAEAPDLPEAGDPESGGPESGDPVSEHAESASQAAAHEAAATPQPPTPPTSPPSPPPSPSPSSEGAQGIPSDRESTAAAVRAAPTVRPGRVLAAQGLEIQTRAPRWSYTTMATRRPRNPTVEITFGSDGRVRRAAFVRDQNFVYNTGSDDVDQPLLNAIYAWTARGKAIDELAPEAPGDEVKVLITIILIG